MMGPEKLSTIRAKVRESLNMTDAEVISFFNRQMEVVRNEDATRTTEIETLRLLRDALIEETKRGVKKAKQKKSSTSPKKKVKKVAASSSSGVKQ